MNTVIIMFDALSIAAFITLAGYSHRMRQRAARATRADGQDVGQGQAAGRYRGVSGVLGINRRRQPQ